MTSEHPADHEPPDPDPNPDPDPDRAPDAGAPNRRVRRWLAGSRSWQPLIVGLLTAVAVVWGAYLTRGGGGDDPEPSPTRQNEAQEDPSPVQSDTEPVVGLREMRETELAGGARRLFYGGTIDHLAVNRRLGILIGPLAETASAPSPPAPLNPESSAPQPRGAFSLAEVDRKQGTWQLTVVVGKLGPDRVFRPYEVPPGLHEGCTGEHPCDLHYTGPPQARPEPLLPGHVAGGQDDLAELEALPFEDLREAPGAGPRTP
uniref:Uncharacterized protein n=1 Tax=Streptomyces sp. NBC_00049 TaxID=2903617 RepID=A0AAU2JH23_9ACTN